MVFTDRPACASGGLSVYTKFCTPSELVHLAERKVFLSALLRSLDEVYSQVAPAIPPITVPAVNAHVRYGGRGNFIAWLRTALRAAYPRALDTTSMTKLATDAFGLHFTSSKERHGFRKNTLNNTLHVLLARGEVEKLHDFKGVPHLAGVWRWKPSGGSFEDVAEQARAMEPD